MLPKGEQDKIRDKFERFGFWGGGGNGGSHLRSNEPSNAGLVKIGITTGDVAERIKQLDGTAVPCHLNTFMPPK
jgi:hypothetical protein